MMRRSVAVLLLVACVWTGSVADVLFAPETVRSMREALVEESPEADALRRHLRHVADEWMTRGPWSVTDHASPAVSGNPHDYFSEGPYWWPDPDNPDGPYIRKDGVVNPERFEHHHKDVNRMMQAVSILALAGYLLDEPGYSNRAAEVLRVWCVDEDTRMNPHMQFAQAIRGRTDGRGIGIIDIRRSVEWMQGLAFLRLSDTWDVEERETVNAWVQELMVWLTTSENGLDEKNHYNNHAVWWSAQVAAMAIYLGDDETARSVWDHTRDVMIPNQIVEDGRMPHELKRTLSLNYTVMNTNGFGSIARMAHVQELDLWNHASLDGQSIRTAAEYTVDALENPDAWEYAQIKRFRPSQQSFLLFGGVDCDKPGWIEMNDTFPSREDAIGLYMKAYRLTLDD